MGFAAFAEVHRSTGFAVHRFRSNSGALPNVNDPRFVVLSRTRDVLMTHVLPGNCEIYYHVFCSQSGSAEEQTFGESRTSFSRILAQNAVKS